MKAFNRSLGIDHPVVAVRDHGAVLERYRAIGFSPSPLSYHPWGTVLSLMMFRESFIEVIGVHEAAKFGTNSVNGFCYGRNVGTFLDRAEGLSLVALHSKDADTDHRALIDRGLASQGRIDFRRTMTKPDDSQDVAVVSLGLFLDEEYPDISHFICHQHRPELIWVPEWQNHPNGVDAIAAVSYLASDPAALIPRFEALYGRERLSMEEDTLLIDAGCGEFRVLTAKAAGEVYGPMPLPVWPSDAPHGFAVTLRTSRFDELPALWAGNGVAFRRGPSGTLLLHPSACGNVILEFVP